MSGRNAGIPSGGPDFRLAGLNIFPVKSCGGIALERAVVEARGFVHDRRWMVVDEEGKFLSQRTEPRLALVRPRIGDDALSLTAPGMGTVRLLQDRSAGKKSVVAVWGDRVESVEPDPGVSRWFSDFLGRSVRLVAMPDSSVRGVNPHYGKPEDHVSFADAFPFLLISEASLSGLNARLAEALPMDRFRPNLVVTGTAPHEEDTWKRIRVGSAEFRVVKPCSRCVTTTVDQGTGRTGKEPLATLATYRSRNGNVYFGQNLIGEGSGEVCIGDSVEIVSKSML